MTSHQFRKEKLGTRGVDRRIRSLVLSSGISLKQAGEALGLTSQGTMNWWSTRRGLSSKNVESMSQYFGVSEDSLLFSDGSSPVSLMRERILHGPKALPDVYGHFASSYVRSSAHIIELLAMMYGRRAVDRLLISMNIHPLLFSDLNNRINLLFFMDLLNRLDGTLGLGEEQIESLGCYVFLGIQGTSLGSEFRKANTYLSFFELLSKNATAFDTNFEYRWDIDDREVRLYAYPTEAERFLMELDPKSYQRLFRYKRRLVGWMPILSDLAPLNALTPYCISKGDPFTLYRVKIPRPGPQRPTLRLLRSPRM